MLNRVVDRDGAPGSPRGRDELDVPPEAPAVLAQLKQAGFLLVCVTNQPEVPRGLLAEDALAAINQAVREILPLDDLLMCVHDDADACGCRKPRPGLLLEAARRHGIDLGASFMVGDRWRDVGAGAAAGCRTVLVENGYEDQAPPSPPDAVVPNLAAAAAWILAQPAEPRMLH